MRRVLLLAALGAALLLGGCASASGDDAIVVSAASSLTEAFTELAAAFEDAHPGVEVRLNFASSAALAAQIVEGAPADVFASANEAQMQAAGERAQAPETFAENRIVVVTPVEGPSVDAFEDLADEGVRLVLAGEDVPVGDYAREAIARADASGALGASFAEDVLANVVSEEANVRAVLTRVELGEADAGIVYETDASVSRDRVRVVPVPPEYAPDAAYFIAPVGQPPSDLAREFMAFVLAEDGQAILDSHGFSGVP